MAEIYIQNDHVIVKLEIFVSDIMTFARLIPDDVLEEGRVERPPQAERLLAFSNEDFQVLADGEHLVAELRTFEPRIRQHRPSPFVGKINPYTRQIVPGPPEDKRVVFVELAYPFQVKPRKLTFIPPQDEKGVSKVSIGFMTFHNRVPLHDFKFLSQSATVTLDWDDPWYSEFENKALRRWQTAGVMSYLYVEPYEVRHEILARVKDLAAWIDLELQGKEFIEADENDPLKKRVGEFFLKRDKVLVDGKQLEPILDRVSFVKYSPTVSIFVQQPEQLPIDTTMIGVIITYLTDGMPQEVSSQWDLWSERTRQVPTDAIDPAGGLPSLVTPDDNIQRWKNFLKQYTIPTVNNVGVADSLGTIELPIGSLVCGLLLLPLAWWSYTRYASGKPMFVSAMVAVGLVAGAFLLYPYMNVSITRPGSVATQMTDDERVAIVTELLRNVYRAFDFRDEEDVYDKLAISASGDLLTKLYLQNRKSFQVEQAGGAQAKVKHIDVQEVRDDDDVKNGNEMTLRSRWIATGTVGHWGHIHTRQNQYEANITVQPVDGAWKITDLDVLHESRVEPGT